MFAGHRTLFESIGDLVRCEANVSTSWRDSEVIAEISARCLSGADAARRGSLPQRVSSGT